MNEAVIGHSAMPRRRVMLIRHAEKPHDDVIGITREGRRSKRSLTPCGWQRAGALAQFFRAEHAPSLSVPSAIYASRIEAGEKSRRPRHTVEPLGALLGIAVDHQYGHKGEHHLAQAVLEEPGPVLICWHHEGIPELCRMIAADLAVPESWPDDRFDVVWVLDQESSTGSWALTQVPQLLLHGDQDTII